MAVLYVTEPGAVLTKSGQRLQVEKKGQVIHWVHAHRLQQVVLLGPVSLSAGALAFLLQEGIDTVFLSASGKYRGRLLMEFGKNVELRRRQYRLFDTPEVQCRLAQSYVWGKITNCRLLLRRYNYSLQRPEVTAALHQLRRLGEQVRTATSPDQVMGLEGAAAATYFGVFGLLLRAPGIEFSGRNRRPPRDPVNVLLSLGYTLLANAVQTQIMLTGLDPYLGCLHRPEYGRPSLVLDLMEEFRPLLVDTVVLASLNRRIITAGDFYRPEDREPPAYPWVREEEREEYPIILAGMGMKKFIAQFEARLQQRVLYLPKGERLTYRQIILEQVRRLVRFLQEEEPYEPFLTTIRRLGAAPEPEM